MCTRGSTVTWHFSPGVKQQGWMSSGHEQLFHRAPVPQPSIHSGQLLFSLTTHYPLLMYKGTSHLPASANSHLLSYLQDLFFIGKLTKVDENHTAVNLPIDGCKESGSNPWQRSLWRIDVNGNEENWTHARTQQVQRLNRQSTSFKSLSTERAIVHAPYPTKCCHIGMFTSLMQFN